MRPLTKREQTLFALAGSVAIIALLLKFAPLVRHGMYGTQLTVKREQFQTSKELVELAEITEQAHVKLREKVGLQGKIIPDSLFQEISKEEDALKSLNRARTTSDLAKLHPALEGKADALFAYRTEHSRLKSLDALKEIEGSIFAGEEPQVVIAKRIDGFTKKAGLKPNYQLNIKRAPGKKSETIPTQARQNLVLHLYLDELDAELEELQKQQEEAERKQAEAEDEALNAVYDAWWDDDEMADTEDNPDKVDDDSEPPKTEKSEPSDEQVDKDASDPEGDKKSEPAPEKSKPSNEQVDEDASDPEGDKKSKPAPEKAKKAIPPQKEAPADVTPTAAPESDDTKRQFAPLPKTIPVPLRIALIQFIRSNIELQMAGAADSKKGFIENQVRTSNIKPKRGFLGIGRTTADRQTTLKPNSPLLAKFKNLMRDYNQQFEHDSEEETEAGLNYEAQLNALTEYTGQILEQKKELQGWIAKVSSTHQPQIYTVEMNFKGQMDKMVKLIQSIESSSKWLFLKRLKISTDQKNKNQPELNINLSMVAKIL